MAEHRWGDVYQRGSGAAEAGGEVAAGDEEETALRGGRHHPMLRLAAGER